MKHTDIPMDGIHEVQESLETLDRLIDEGRGNLRCSFVRVVLLGIMATLDAAIVTINES